MATGGRTIEAVLQVWAAYCLRILLVGNAKAMDINFDLQ